MGVLRDKFISDFHLKFTGSKGWQILPVKTVLYCPNCQNKDGSRLAFIFDENSSTSSFRCVKCGFSCRLEKYLWLVKKTEYVTKYREVKPENILKKKELVKTENQNIDLSPLPKVVLPILFKQLKYSKYLKERGANLDIYKHWIIGKTDLEKSLRNYIIFVIPENGINVGWVARCEHSKEYIDNYNKTHDKKILRWRNSESDFGRIVFGLDEITENTKELIIVEGITSKLRVDCELKLYKQDNLKCVCTFGKKITDTQIIKIKNKGINVNKIILFYDSDAVNESKKTTYKFVDLFNTVLVAFCKFKNEKGEFKDAGDLNKEEMNIVFNELQTPFQFFETKLPKKSLIKR